MKIIHKIKRLNQLADKAYWEVAESIISPSQLIVMQALIERPGCSQTDLVEATDIDRSTMANIIQRLINSRMVERAKSDTDRRAYVVVTTERGREETKTAMRTSAKAEKRLLSEVEGLRLLNLVA